jgi:predicted aconitase with swiveling domain
MNQTELQLASIINEHRNAIVALEAIVAAIPKQTKIDAEIVKQKVKDSKVFGKLSDSVLAEAEKTALRILG